MVLASCGDRKLFFRTARRCAVEYGVARHALGNGHGRDLKHALRRPDCGCARPGRQADRRCRKSTRKSLSALRGRSRLVDGCREGPAPAKSTALLIKPSNLERVKPTEPTLRTPATITATIAIC